MDLRVDPDSATRILSQVEHKIVFLTRLTARTLASFRISLLEIASFAAFVSFNILPISQTNLQKHFFKITVQRYFSSSFYKA